MATEKTDDNKIYLLKEDARIYYIDSEEIRFRKGLWNYNEAIIKLHGQDERVKSFFTIVADGLHNSGEIDAGMVADRVGATPEEVESYCRILDNIKNQGFLYGPEDREIRRIVSSLLGGNILGFEDYIYEPRPVLLVADNDYSKEAAKSIADQIKLPLDIMDTETFAGLGKLDLTTKTDAMDYLKGLEKYQSTFGPYDCVIGSFVVPNISLLRNLNRVLISLEKPLILGLIDGPFISILSTLAKQTGCFECFEHRMLARLEDSIVYHRFVDANRQHVSKRDAIRSTVFSPLAHILSSAVVMEGFMHATFGMLRLAGRIVSVYMPLLEIQVQDLLRVPYCPACGFVSQSQMDEMYTSSRRIVDEMLGKVEIAKPPIQT